MSKYGNRKVKRDGMVFDSKREADRWNELKLLEKAGEIYGLKRQVEFVLLDKQYSKTEFTKRGKPRVAEKKLSYVADFTYFNKDHEYIVEDAKGFRTESYRIKKKLMLFIHGISLKEV